MLPRLRRTRRSPDGRRWRRTPAGNSRWPPRGRARQWRRGRSRSRAWEPVSHLDARTGRRAPPKTGSGAVAAEQCDLVLADAVTLFRVLDAETLTGGEAEHADFALVLIAMDRSRGHTDLGERVHGRQQRMDATLVDQPVCRPRLGVVREMAGDQPLQLHPEVPVVELDHVSRRRRARDD